MAHFAELDKDNIVTKVLVVSNAVITKDGKEVEQLGIDFLANLYGHSEWVQTSYNASYRGGFAGKGDTYDRVHDVFIHPQPFPSWTLNAETGKWIPPVEMPTVSETTHYKWDELEQNWEGVDISV
jgi:hypothetical protein